MNLSKILFSVLDELDLTDAMDGEGDRFGSDAQGRGGWLEAHDRRFHNGHFDPETQTCGLRDRLQAADNVDYITSMNEHGDVRAIPLRSEFSDLLGRAYEAGVLTEDVGAEIDAMYQDVVSWMNLADDGSDVPQQVKDSMRGLVDIENALRLAMEEPTEDTSSRPSRVPPVQRLVTGYQDRLVRGFPPNWRNWHRQIQRTVGAGDTAACVRELLEHPENPNYRELLDEYTEFGLSHPTSWAARMMGTIERTHPDWRGAEQSQPNVSEDNFICKDRPSSTRYGNMFRFHSGGSPGIDFLKDGKNVTICVSERQIWAADDAEAADGLADYNRRKQEGQTTELEDKFHQFGLHASPHFIPPITKKQIGMTCYACHAVSAIRALFNIPVRPHGRHIGQLVAAKIWAQVRTSAFPGAIGLVNKEVAQRESENAPIGSVIMASNGGHCKTFQKTQNGWRVLETYSGDIVGLNTSIADSFSYPDTNASALLSNREGMERYRRRHGVQDTSVSDEAVACASRGAILITPEIAKNCRPEYLSGAWTGIPYEDNQRE